MQEIFFIFVKTADLQGVYTLSFTADLFRGVPFFMKEGGDHRRWWGNCAEQFCFTKLPLKILNLNTPDDFSLITTAPSVPLRYTSTPSFIKTGTPWAKAHGEKISVKLLLTWITTSRKTATLSLVADFTRS